MNFAELLRSAFSTLFGLAFVGGLLGFMWKRVATIRWQPLTHAYAAKGVAPSSEKRFENVIVHGESMTAYHRYQACVAVGVCETGMILRLQGPYATFHPPLLLPFEEMSVKPKKWFLISAFEITMMQTPSVHLVVYPSILKWLDENAATDWRARVGLAPETATPSW